MMQMSGEKEFEDIRPYTDEEVNPAINRMINHPFFRHIHELFFPQVGIDNLKDELSGIHSSYEFQSKFMHLLVKSVVNKTSAGLTFNGFEKLEKNKSYLFVANHRDIVLDSAILQMLLLTQGYVSTEITFGSNLMKGDFVIDFGKINRMFRLDRGGSKTELIRNSKRTSAYIRHTITEKKLSVWIAQRPGRTKNGDDRTEAGLLKMFFMSSCHDFSASMSELNIVPVIISYEFEPCCAYKVREILELRKKGTYMKQPGEDLKSIVCGITQPKGRIHMSIGDPVNGFLHGALAEKNLNRKLTRLAVLIDEQVYRNYRLWPNNYIAFDILCNSSVYAHKYTSAEKDSFHNYIRTETDGLEGNPEEIKETLLKIYANPVINVNRILSS